MRFRILLLALLMMPFGMAGCAFLEQIAALRQVEFDIDGVDNVRLAGVHLDQVHSPQQLPPDAFARIASVFATGQMPLGLNLNIGAENPPENRAAARLLRMDWTFLLSDIETISGVFEDERLIAPGQRDIISLAMQMDLLRFFEHNLQGMISLGMALAGHGQQEVALRFTPTVTTPMGPIRYPGAITIRHTVGG